MKRDQHPYIDYNAQMRESDELPGVYETMTYYRTDKTRSDSPDWDAWWTALQRTALQQAFSKHTAAKQ